MSYKRIGDYGVIGDLHTVALVGNDGSIDWCCLPHFNSPSVFGAILDDAKGGRFGVQPVEEWKASQRYEGLNAVLVTRFETASGVAEVSDFMPLSAEDHTEEERHWHEIHRVVRCLKGHMELEVVCEPRFDYGRARADLVTKGVNAVARSRAGVLTLQSSVPWMVEQSRFRARLRIQEREETAVVLFHGAADRLGPFEMAKTRAKLEATRSFWSKWVDHCRYDGRWREAVLRSAITLKLLIFAPSGAIVAAPTTSLPEWIGGERNWDYRYTWLRDAVFTLYALFRLGFTEEAYAFFRWFARLCKECGEHLQIMYRLDGESRIPRETILRQWEGYKGSRPVRVGNAAVRQRQWDVYGELVGSFHLYRTHGGEVTPELWASMASILDHVCHIWRRPDEGIWEVRFGNRHFVYSKVMCWLALDRGILAAEEKGYPAPSLGDWKRTRDRIREEILTRGVDGNGAFRQHYGTSAMDASNLVLPLIRFLDVQDPRVQETLDRTLEDLGRNGLVMRYLVPDGFRSEEGAFGICTFWLVENLALSGRIEEALPLFERMLTYANPLGLYSEEIDPSTGELLGNSPQALTHVGLITAAWRLDRALEKRKVGSAAAQTPSEG